MSNRYNPAMAVYTKLDDDAIRAFLNDYTVGELVSAKGIVEGVENTNYLLTVARNGKESRYILTVYEKRVNPEELPFFMGVMEQLAHEGVACPRPLHSIRGGTVRELAGKPAAMVTFLEGKNVRSIQNAHVGALGEAMAKMHLAIENSALERNNDLSIDGWETLFDKVKAQADAYRPDLQAMLSEELAYLREHWPSHLPHGIIHADLFPDNVFFQGTELTGIIDFYFACTDAFVYDIAITMNAWCFEQHSEFNVTKANALLKAYHAVRPLSDAELEALPILARGAALRFLLTRLHDWLFQVEGAEVTVKDPGEYIKKWAFHCSVKRHQEYGL
jgi:homoserine kinase type II